MNGNTLERKREGKKERKKERKEKKPGKKCLLSTNTAAITQERKKCVRI